MDFSLFFLEYLFSKGNIQPRLKTFLQISPDQIGLFWGAEGYITSVFILQPPFISMIFFFFFWREERRWSLGLLTFNFYFLLTSVFSACFSLLLNPLHKLLPSGGLAQWALRDEGEG